MTITSSVRFLYILGGDLAYCAPWSSILRHTKITGFVDLLWLRNNYRHVHYYKTTIPKTAQLVDYCLTTA